MQRRRRLAAAWSLMGSGALVLAGGGALALPSLIHAAPSYVVTNCTTSNTNGAGKTPAAGDLEWAVDQANTTPGTITFTCAPGSTIAVVGTLDVTNTMTINGLSTDKKTPVILDGGNSVQLFYANASGMVFTLENLTMQHGAEAPGIIGIAAGGAVLLGAGTLDATDDTFSNNTAQSTATRYTPGAFGGAIFELGGTVNITNSTFLDNSATGSTSSSTSSGAGGGAVVDGGPGALTITGSTFKGNTASFSVNGKSGDAIAEGGAIDNTDTGNLTISSSVFEDNSATATTPAGDNLVSAAVGGALYHASTGTLTIQSGTIFERNAATATGDTAIALGGAVVGGFLGAPTAVALDHTSLIDNTASATITGDNLGGLVSPNVPNSGGGGLYVLGSPLTLTNSTIGGNTAATTLAKGATATFALSYGGGLVAEGTPNGPFTTTPLLVTIDDSTISGNSVSEPLVGSFPTGALGGGVMNVGDTLTLTRATIAQNAVSGTTDSSGGGLASVFGATTTIGASILAENTATTGPDCYFQTATESDLGYNLESGTDCFGKTPATGDKQNVSTPKLASALANNGGPTPTLALLAGSPAIDAIPDPTTVVSGTTTYNLCPGTPASDQRGVARPQGAGCDIGAYEYQKPTPSTGLSGNGAPHTPITAHTTTHSGTAPKLPSKTTLPTLPKLPKLTPQQPVVSTVVAHTPTSGFPLALAALLAILGFALLGGGALVLGRTRETDGR